LWREARGEGGLRHGKLKGSILWHECLLNKVIIFLKVMLFKKELGKSSDFIIEFIKLQLTSFPSIALCIPTVHNFTHD